MALALIEDNPYRVLGLGTQAHGSRLASNHKKMMSELLKGNEITLGQDLVSYVRAPLRNPRRIDHAKSQLSTVKGRLYYALFWFMDANKLDHAALFYLSKGDQSKGEKIWLSNPTASALINLAVLALINERYDDAIKYYTQCLQDEELSQSFIRTIIGDRLKMKGIMLLSKAVSVVEQERAKKEKEDNSDERSYAGAGFGVRNQESQNRPKLASTQVFVDRATSLQLRKQNRNFDRHLNESLTNFLEKIQNIGAEHGMEASGSVDPLPAELTVNSAASLVLEEINNFLKINYGLIDTFRNRCFELNERSLYLDYVYNLISICHYAFHLYAIDLGRMYSNSLVQQIRSIRSKLAHLYFRIKSDELDYMISSIQRLEESLPYLYEIELAFERYYVFYDQHAIVSNFEEFYAKSRQVLDEFNKQYAALPHFVDRVQHLQEMIVRFNVTFILAMTDFALNHSKNRKFNNKGELQVQNTMYFAGQSNPNLNSNNGNNKENVDNAEDNNQGGSLETLRSPNQEEAEVNNESAPNQYTQINPPLLKGRSGAIEAHQASGNVVIQNAKIVGNKPLENKKGVKAQFDNVQQNGFVTDKGTKVSSDQLEKMYKRLDKKRSSFLKRQLSKKRKDLKLYLEGFTTFAISAGTMALIKVTEQQVDRLPPPVSFKSVIIGILLIILALALVFLNIQLH